MVLGAGVGARLVYLAIHPDLWSNPYDWLRFWEGGMVSYGGLGGGLMGLYLFRRLGKLPQISYYNEIAPNLLIGWGVGRLGCFLTWHGEEGTPSDLPWAVEVGTQSYHPATLYLSIVLILGGLVLRRSQNERALHTLMYYSLARGALDNFRVYYPESLRWASQLACSVLFLASVSLILIAKKNSDSGR